MKITAIRPYLVDSGVSKNWLFVKVETSEGIHGWGEYGAIHSTTIGLAATLHAAAAMSNFLITEYFVNFEERSREIASVPFTVVDSTIELPATPGLGQDLDEAVLARYPYREMSARPLRQPQDE